MAIIHEKYLRGRDVSGEIPDADVFFKGLEDGALLILNEMATRYPKPDEVDLVGAASGSSNTSSARKIPVFSYLDKNVKGEALRLALAANELPSLRQSSHLLPRCHPKPPLLFGAPPSLLQAHLGLEAG